MAARPAGIQFPRGHHFLQSTASATWWNPFRARTENKPRVVRPDAELAQATRRGHWSRQPGVIFASHSGRQGMSELHLICNISFLYRLLSLELSKLTLRERNLYNDIEVGILERQTKKCRRGLSQKARCIDCRRWRARQPRLRLVVVQFRLVGNSLRRKFACGRVPFASRSVMRQRVACLP